MGCFLIIDSSQSCIFNSWNVWSPHPTSQASLHHQWLWSCSRPSHTAGPACRPPSLHASPSRWASNQCLRPSPHRPSSRVSRVPTCPCLCLCPSLDAKWTWAPLDFHRFFQTCLPLPKGSVGQLSRSKVLLEVVSTKGNSKRLLMTVKQSKNKLRIWNKEKQKMQPLQQNLWKTPLQHDPICKINVDATSLRPSLDPHKFDSQNSFAWRTVRPLAPKTHFRYLKRKNKWGIHNEKTPNKQTCPTLWPLVILPEYCKETWRNKANGQWIKQTIK